MINNVIFIGDEMSATAYRLAGMGTIIIEPEKTARVLDEEMSSDVTLVLLGSAHAESLGMEELGRRIRLATPPIMIVRDVSGRTPVPDLVTMLRTRLGVAT